MLNRFLCALLNRKGSSDVSGGPSGTPDEFLNVCQVEECTFEVASRSGAVRPEITIWGEHDLADALV